MLGEFEFQVPRTLGRWTRVLVTPREHSVYRIVPPRSSEGYRLSPESNCSNINYNRRAIRMFERSGFEQVRAGTGPQSTVPCPTGRPGTGVVRPCALSLACYEVLASHTTPATPRGRTPRTARPVGTGPGADLARLEEPAPTSQSRAGATRSGRGGGGACTVTVALQYRPARV